MGSGEVVRDDTYAVGRALFEVINCGFSPPSLYGPGAVNLQKTLDAYIDARIAEKVPEPVTRLDVTPEQAKKYKQAVADFDRMMSNVEPAPPTAREVHEAWRKWRTRLLASGLVRLEIYRPSDDTITAPSFPELET